MKSENLSVWHILAQSLRLLLQPCALKEQGGFLSLQTCVCPWIVMLKASLLLDSCEAKLIWNASWVLSASWRGHWSCSASRHRTHTYHPFSLSEDGDHALTCWQRLFEFFLLGRLRMVPFHGFPFVSTSKWCAQVSTGVTIWERKVSPTSSKFVNISEEMAFLLVFCWTVRLQGAQLAHTFKYPTSWMMWLTLPLLIERLSASHWVVCDDPREWRHQHIAAFQD